MDELQTPEGRQIVQAGRDLYQGGCEDEREKIVAWLQTVAVQYDCYGVIFALADRLRAGEHAQ